jgi:hypothetical protein
MKNRKNALSHIAIGAGLLGLCSVLAAIWIAPMIFPLLPGAVLSFLSVICALLGGIISVVAYLKNENQLLYSTGLALCGLTLAINFFVITIIIAMLFFVVAYFFQDV